MKPYLSGEGSPNRGGLSLPKNKRILGAALLLVLGLIFVFFAVSPWEILPFLKGGSFRVQAGIIGGFHLPRVNSRVEKTAEFLASLHPGPLYPCHCVSLAAKCRLMRSLDVREVGSGMCIQL